MNIKDAVTAATDFARAVYDGEELRELRLEEVEPDQGERLWKITLGWIDPAFRANGILAQLNTKAPRVYKTFNVDVVTGEVQSMKIRETS